MATAAAVAVPVPVPISVFLVGVASLENIILILPCFGSTGLLIFLDAILRAWSITPTGQLSVFRANKQRGMSDTVVRRAMAHGKPARDYKKDVVVKGGGKMGLIKGYKYVLEAEPGLGFDPRFKPALTPGEILFMGAFEGKYLNDCTDEFPQEWYLNAAAANRLSPSGPDLTCNYFGVGSRQSLQVWQENGWAPRRGSKARGTKVRDILADAVANPDERGWFQWYCRYWLGRRIPDLDSVQIGRWRSFARHAGAIKARCAKGDLTCNVRERQALLQWAYNPFI